MDRSAPSNCPNCRRELPPAYTLIEYEKHDGTVGAFAECPACDDVVKLIVRE